jgi:hypothetical protein
VQKYLVGNIVFGHKTKYN